MPKQEQRLRSASHCQEHSTIVWHGSMIMQRLIFCSQEYKKDGQDVCMDTVFSINIFTAVLVKKDNGRNSTIVIVIEQTKEGRLA